MDLAKRVNFSINHLLKEDPNMIKLINSSWGGPITRIVSGEADIAVGPFGMSISRMSICDFTHSLYKEPQYLHVKKPDGSSIPWFRYVKVLNFKATIHTNFNHTCFTDFSRHTVDRSSNINDSSHFLFRANNEKWKNVRGILS